MKTRMRRRIVSLLTCLALLTGQAHAALPAPNHPFYVSYLEGLGWTTWQGLVPAPGEHSVAMAISTPTNVEEGGAVWGFVAGYELLQTFAIEAAYMSYPEATINFDPTSLFAFEHGGLTTFTSRTQTVSLMGKVLLVIPRTEIRAYSSFGMAEVHRSDQLNEHWMLSPTFGLGLTTDFGEHVVGQLGAVYVAGFGESELNPVEDYFPFLYSVYLTLGYRF